MNTGGPDLRCKPARDTATARVESRASRKREITDTAVTALVFVVRLALSVSEAAKLASLRH
jgi:hypothetical protein